MPAKSLSPGTATALTGTAANATRDRIIEAARICYARSDISQTTMVDIAQQAGIGRATLYRHFPTREAVLLAVYRKEVGEFLQRFQREAARAETFCGLLLDYMVFTLQQADTTRLYNVLFAEQSALWVSRTYLADDETLAMTAAVFRESFLVARRVGEIAMDLELEDIVGISIRLLMTFILVPGAKLQDEAGVRAYFEKYLLRTLRP
jgi:AcrR family transcriptional regulator